MEDYQNKLQKLNTLLVKKADEILVSTYEDPTIDTPKLKNELQTLAFTFLQDYITKTKPQ